MINFVPSIGSKSQNFSPEQQKELRKHFDYELSRHVGIESDLFVYGILLLVVVAALPLIIK